MDSANLYIGTELVFANATFQRVPTLGEFVSFKYQWHNVTSVGHTWTDNSSAPVVNLSIEPLHPEASDKLAYEAGAGPVTSTA